MNDPAQIKVVEIDASAQHGTGLLATDDSIWITVAPRWWDIASWLWWWLAPSNKTAFIQLRTRDGRYVRSRAIRVATRHVRLGHAPKPQSETKGES